MRANGRISLLSRECPPLADALKKSVTYDCGLAATVLRLLFSV